MSKLAIVIDDDADDIDFLCQTIALLNVNIECRSFKSSSAAVKSLANPAHEAPDYIFLDYNMPVLNGIECYTQLKAIARLAHTRFILNSTTVSTEVKKTFLALGGYLVFEKPISTEQFRVLVGQALLS